MTRKPTDRAGSKWHRVASSFKAEYRARNEPCWICQGELGRIDYTAPAGESNAFELDHCIPVSEDASLLWVHANYRASHCSCNRSRAARSQRKRKPSPLPAAYGTGRWVRPSDLGW